MTKLAFIDTETVAVEPGPATIWELALIVRDGGEDTEHLWHMRPDLAAANPVSLKIGGYYERCKARSFAIGNAIRIGLPTGEFPDENDYIGPREVAGQVATLLDRAHLVAANPWFDASHLDGYLRANGECGTWDYHMTDLGSLVRGRLADKNIKMPWPLKFADAARAMGIDAERYEAHTALGDVRMLRDVFDAVTGGRL